MTPPERVRFRRRTPLRVAVRLGWIGVWVGMLTILFDIDQNPGWLATIIVVGVPVLLRWSSVAKKRKFYRTRAAAWDEWFRSQGSSWREVQAWWRHPDTTPEQRQEFASLWGTAA